MSQSASKSDDPTPGPTLKSQDVVAGLGLAPRDLLATCLALFEDSTLQQRLNERLESLKKNFASRDTPEKASKDTITSLQQRITQWMQAPLPDDELRLILWMRLREAYSLVPLTFSATRSARAAADDLVAATLASVQLSTIEKAQGRLGWGSQREVPGSLDDLSRMTMAELLANVMDVSDPNNAKARDTLVNDLKKHVSQLDQASKDKLLEAINARELNDDAIRTLLLTGGGLATFGSAVSIAGFSAYILAAQASAFIPLISGPALVSFVAVLSNPITILLATVGTGAWATRSANDKIQAAIAMRVVALLTLNGIAAGDAGLRRMTRAFRLLPEMRQAGTLNPTILTKYQSDWTKIRTAQSRPSSLSPELGSVMDRSVTDPMRWERLLQKGDSALPDMAAMGTLSLGELLYNIHALDPEVLKAANFSRVSDLSDPVAFAAFAHQIEDMTDDSHLGAISNLKGYVAEQMVASQLIQQGHVVVFPETSNEAGWDLEVDGIKFQVKNAADFSLLDRHFEQYDYPVLANSEIADQLASEAGNLPYWAERVHFVEGYSQAGVQNVTDQTLDAGDGMLHPHVPTFALLLAAVRGLDRYQKGQVSGSQAIQDVVINGSVRAGLAVAGNYAGVAIGLLIFGPAGALVLGSTLPILSRTQSERAKEMLERFVPSDKYKVWEKDARLALDALRGTLHAGLIAKAEGINAKSWNASNVAADYLAWRQEDDLRFLHEAGLRLAAIGHESKLPVEDAGNQILVWLSTSTLHPAVYQAELSKWIQLWERRPAFYEVVKETMKEVRDIVTGFIGGIRFAVNQPRSGKSKK